MKGRYKAICLGLLLIAIAFSFIGMFAGCRSVKKHTQRTYVQYDSTGLHKSLAVKETLITERADSPFIFNPGDFSGYFNSLDTSEQRFTTDGYDVSVKPRSDGKGKFSIKGKDQKKDVPIYRTSATKETVQNKQESRVSNKVSIKETEKRVSSTSWWVIIPCGIALVAGGIYLTKKHLI